MGARGVRRVWAPGQPSCIVYCTVNVVLLERGENTAWSMRKVEVVSVEFHHCMNNPASEGVCALVYVRDAVPINAPVLE